MAELNFDANTVEPATAFEPIPAGDYLAVITDSEIKATSAGTGSYLAITFEIVEGQFKGRKLWSNLNLQNPSQQAVDIARAELSAICRAVGVMAPKDSQQLHNIPLTIGVKCSKRKDTGEIQNAVKSYEKRGGNSSTAKNATPADTTNKAPWKR